MPGGAGPKTPLADILAVSGKNSTRCNETGLSKTAWRIRLNIDMRVSNAISGFDIVNLRSLRIRLCYLTSGMPPTQPNMGFNKEVVANASNPWAL